MKYRVVSTDDHLQESPDLWTDRMSKAKWGDRIPQIKPLANGTDSWHIDGKPTGGIGAVHGAMADRNNPPTKWADVPIETYIPAERVKAMDRDGVDVHSFFGNLAGTAGQTFNSPTNGDADFRLECIQAYNDFQIDAFAQPYPGRFITLANLPLWDIDLAVAEARRMAKRGVSALSLAFPQQFGYKNIRDKYWDPLWAFSQDADLSLNYHIGGGGSQGLMSDNWPEFAPMHTMAESACKFISANTQVMSLLLHSGIMTRFPTLKFVSSESGVGWVPYLMEVADYHHDRFRLWEQGFKLKMSEYFQRQCYVNFWFERIGPEELKYVDNILWESDFPHPTCTYPDSQEFIKRALKDVTPEQRQKMLVGNAVKLFHLDKYQD